MSASILLFCFDAPKAPSFQLSAFSFQLSASGFRLPGNALYLTHSLQAFAQCGRDCFSIFGYPLPLLSIRIMHLRPNCEIIYGAQRLRGKILSRKYLAASFGRSLAAPLDYGSNCASRATEIGTIPKLGTKAARSRTEACRPLTRTLVFAFTCPSADALG